MTPNEGRIRIGSEKNNDETPLQLLAEIASKLLLPLDPARTCEHASSPFSGVQYSIGS